MRKFHSYGPVDSTQHFSVPRRTLVEQCRNQLVDKPEKGGHYFTIWAPRQSGKTWLMRQVREEIKQLYGDQFTVFDFSLGNLRGLTEKHLADQNSEELPNSLSGILEFHLPGHPIVKTWEEFSQLFSREGGLWDRPVILLIDESDTAPPSLLGSACAQC